MSKRTRRNFSAGFESKVAIEALRERMALSELAAKYELDPNQITKGKSNYAPVQSTSLKETKEVDGLTMMTKKRTNYIRQSVSSK